MSELIGYTKKSWKGGLCFKMLLHATQLAPKQITTKTSPKATLKRLSSGLSEPFEVFILQLKGAKALNCLNIVQSLLRLFFFNNNNNK